jgi:hypothetical protein
LFKKKDQISKILKKKRSKKKTKKIIKLLKSSTIRYARGKFFLPLLNNACISKTRLFAVLKPWAIDNSDLSPNVSQLVLAKNLADPNLFF